MNLSIYNNISKYNQKISPDQQQKSTRGILYHCIVLLNNARISLVEN